MIHTINFIQLAQNGSLELFVPPAKVNSGVKIDFSDVSGNTHSLYYFQVDLSDTGLLTSGFLRFCAKLGPGRSLLKGASYLLHRPDFSETRDFLLRHSSEIIQDDTGIPLRYFDKDKWLFIPFGSYRPPIRPFRPYEQKSMHELYELGKPRPVEFGFGYRWRANEANILLVRRK
jgi:hypothetical protein